MTNLGELLDGFHHYAWRLEALDTYDISDERDQFEQFLAGRTPDPSDDDLEWQARARAVVASGRSIGRVRVVGHPITDYTRPTFTPVRPCASSTAPGLTIRTPAGTTTSGCSMIGSSP